MPIGLGIDVGGSKILACAIDASGRLLVEHRVDSPPTRDDLVHALCHVIVEVVLSLQKHGEQLTAVGIGLPGLVDADDILNETPNIPRAEGLDLRASLIPLLKEQYVLHDWPLSSVPSLTIENDATCAAAGEWAFGAAQGKSDAVVITLGTGIGGGLIVNGKIARGARGFAGEIGHMVIHPGGPPCGCGGHGCWEQYASGTGIERLAREAVADGRASRILELAGSEVNDIRGEHVIEAMREKNDDAIAIMHEFARYLAVGLSNLVEILDPDCIILSGGLSRVGEFFIEQTKANLATFRRGNGPRAVPILMAELQERAGAIGAGGIAIGVAN